MEVHSISTKWFTLSKFLQHMETTYIDFALVRELIEFGREPVRVLEERSLETHMDSFIN